MRVELADGKEVTTPWRMGFSCSAKQQRCAISGFLPARQQKPLRGLSPLSLAFFIRHAPNKNTAGLNRSCVVR